MHTGVSMLISIIGTMVCPVSLNDNWVAKKVLSAAIAATQSERKKFEKCTIFSKIIFFDASDWAALSSKR